MPLYEYRCRKCSRRFEALVFGNEKPSCPKCGGGDLEKQWSAFAVAGGERKSDSDDFGGSGGDFGGDDFGGGMGNDAGEGFGGDMDASSGGCGRCGDPRGPGSCAVN